MNHLGNILSTVSDRKTCQPKQSLGLMMNEDLPNNAGRVRHNEVKAVIVLHSVVEEICVRHNEVKADGLNMPARTFGLEDYLFGFNGKETQNELMRDDNAQDFGARMYDARVIDGGGWNM